MSALITLPGGRAEQASGAALRRRRRAGPSVIGVVGARGGAGASSFAALLAQAGTRHGSAVLVELGAGPSMDAVLGTEGEEGLRWPDLADVRGTVDPEQLAGALRRWRRCAVLTTDDQRPGPPPAAALPDVLDALCAGHETVVLDLDRAAVLDGRCGAVLAECRAVVVVAPRDIPAVAGARLLLRRLPAVDVLTGLVTTGSAPGGLGASELAKALGIPLWGTLGGGRRVARAVDAGAGPQYSWRVTRRVVRLAAELR